MSMRTVFPGQIALLLLNVAAAAGAQEQNRDRPCTPREGTGVVHGTVIDSETRVPLQQAEVILRWYEGQRPRTVERKQDTDRQGRFRICDVALGTPLTLSARYFGEESERRGLTLSQPESPPESLQIAAPHSRVTGRVIAHDTRTPVTSASVRLGNVLPASITTNDGAFLFDKVPPGTYTLDVQHVAYTSVSDSIDVEYLSTVNAVIRVATNVIPIDPLEVTVLSEALTRVGFYTRRERHAGTFLTRHQIEDMHPLLSTDVMRRIPGVRIEPGRFGNRLTARGGCPFRFIMDGARIGPGFSLDDVPPQTIEALEIYMGASEVPIEFQGFSSDRNGNCGVIVIWTRRRA